MDAVDKVPVDLHVIRPQLGPQTQTRIARAQIIQRNGKPHRTIVMQGRLQQFEIVGRGLFGQFDHHLARRDAEVLQQLQGASGLVGRFEQGFGGYVEEQHAGQLLFIETPTSTFAAGDFQLAQASGLTGDGEQGDRGVQRAVGRPATEGLITEDSPLREANDRLEQAVQTALSQN